MRRARAPEVRGNETVARGGTNCDRLLRKTAEFDNCKRVDKERRELSEWAAADVITEVLAVRMISIAR